MPRSPSWRRAAWPRCSPARTRRSPRRSSGSPSPVQSWVLLRAREIEIARRPDLSTRCTHARAGLEHEDPLLAESALRDLGAVPDEAMTV
ncbi:hypothetical protein [Streptomyces sp. WP-1]|uniref:hypothetical protein n=1 Tax=Streptomyces sp. WP-1 TaxID=3041497 RepID=UPI00351B90E6